MIEQFLETHEKFRRANVDDPLRETLKMFDILSDCAFSRLGVTGLLPDLETVIRKRVEGMPLEQILGKTGFMGRSFTCSEETFLPMEQSAILIEAARTILEGRNGTGVPATVIDVCTGCGTLAITLALELTSILLYASDISPAAIATAGQNVSRYGLAARVHLAQGDLLMPFRDRGLEGTVDLILCNPPYIPTRSIDKLPAAFSRFAPRVALDGGPFGIDIFRRLIRESPPLLKPGGSLLFETNEKQETMIERILKDHGGYDVMTCYRRDGNVRAVSVRKKQVESAGRNA